MKEKEDRGNMQRKNEVDEQQLFERKKEEMFEKRKKKELLLAKMQAIDRGENPNKVAESVNIQNDTKHKKKPIFLEGSNTPSPKQKGEADILARERSDFSDGTPKKYRRGKGDVDLVGSAKSDRRNSWDFKQTDENLHKGLPAHGSNENSPSLKRRNIKDSDVLTSGSSSGRNRIHKESEERTSNSSADKKGRRHQDTLGDNNINDVYSPTGSKNPQSSNTKNTNKKNDDLFGQFEDPFVNANKKTNKPNKANAIVFSSDEDDIDTIPAYEPSQPQQRQFKGANDAHVNKRSSARSLRSSNFGDDDLEEMILA